MERRINIIKNIYLVYLYYDDGAVYDSMSWDQVIAIFDTKEKAEQFCNDNSDNKTGTNHYQIDMPRNLMVGSDCVYVFDTDEFYDYDNYYDR